MWKGIRRALLGLALAAGAVGHAAAQLETVVVSAEKREAFVPGMGQPAAAIPHLFILKRADHVITRVRVTCDTRDYAQRVRELKDTLRAMVRTAARTETISLGTGDTIIVDLTEADFDDLISADTNDGRSDTSAAMVIVKTKVSAKDSLKAAMNRINAFLAATPMSGRAEIVRDGNWDLTIVGPEQYRDAIVGLIEADAKHTADAFGPGYGVAVEGLEHKVSWYQKGPLDLALYIPYVLKVGAPATH